MKKYTKSLVLLFTILLQTTPLLFSQSLQVYRNNAVVSFYAEDFHGKKTSNGEIFNMNALTCASKTLPFNTELKITNLKNGKTVVVRVNDRGPFIPDRELDLSKAAATKLGMINAGTAHVKIEIVKLGENTKLSRETAASADKIMTQRFGPNWNKNHTASTGTSKHSDANKKTVLSAPENSLFEIQVASFSTKENAQKCCKKLSEAGIKNIFIRSNKEIFRVVIKNIPKNQLSKIENSLKQCEYKDYIIRIMQK